MKMERKVVLITGGAMGQGRAHALKFAENGFDVVLAQKNTYIHKKVETLFQKT